MYSDFTGKNILITGGTRGIGLETGLAFGKLGGLCILTYRWGDHNENELYSAFEQIGAPKPILIQADAANKEDTLTLLYDLKRQITSIDIFISNVSSAIIVKCFEDYTLKGLKRSLSYSAWPMVEYTKQIFKVFGQYPKYIIGVSSTGPDYYSIGYDFVAASKIVMEILVKYMNHLLRDHQVIINAVRSRAIKTKLLEDTFGSGLNDFAKSIVPNSENYWLTCEELAKSILALCSGYCDGISGQTITVDKGTSFFDNFMNIYSRNQQLSNQ